MTPSEATGCEACPPDYKQLPDHDECDRHISELHALLRASEAKVADFRNQLMAVVGVLDSKRAWDGSRKVMGATEVIDEIEKAFPWIRREKARQALSESEEGKR